MTLKLKAQELPENIKGLGKDSMSTWYVSDFNNPSVEEIQAEPVTPLQVFYVCFSNAGVFPGSRFLKENFSHCSVMQRVPLGYVVTDPTRSALDTYVLPDAPVDRFIDKFLAMRPDYTILEVIKKASNKERNQIRFGVQSCVSVVAYTLGLHIPWYCLTPYQLYKRLKPGIHNILSVRRLYGK